MTSWTNRTVPTTSWSLLRLGGSYLTDVSGNYITDVSGNRIVVMVPGGSLPTTQWDDDRQYHFLIQETLSFLLLETGDKIRLNQFGPKETDWTPRALPT